MILIRLIALAAMTLPFVAQGALVWETQEANLEARSNDREIVATYRFKNTGNNAVAITDVVSSCDCTTTAMSKRSYAPGEEGTITARLAIGSRSGLQETTIAVLTDDSPGEPVKLRLRANIEPLIMLSSPVLSWRIGAEPEEHSTLVAASSPLRIAAVIVKATHPAGVATTRVEPVTDGTHYRVFVRPNSTAMTRNFTVSCSVAFTDGTGQDFFIYGMARK